MVEEYLPADLHDWIRYNNINLTESCAKYIFKQVVLGINHLHNSNIIHRDIASNFHQLLLFTNKKFTKFAFRTMPII